MDVNTVKENQVMIVSVSGRIDAVSCADLENRLNDLINKDERRLILDMKEVFYISSAGLRVLLAVAQQLHGNGRVTLACPQENVREILEIAGFDTIMDIVDDMDAAREDMAKP